MKSFLRNVVLALIFAIAPSTAYGQTYQYGPLNKANTWTAFQTFIAGVSMTPLFFGYATSIDPNTPLLLDVGQGIANCGEPPISTPYGGGSLALTASSTNYIFISGTSPCPVQSNTTGFPAGSVPLASATTSDSVILVVTELQTPFCAGCNSAGGGIQSAYYTGDGTVFNSVVPGSPILPPTGTFAPSLKVVQPSYVLMGPSQIIPGGPATLQANNTFSTDNPPTSFTVAFQNNTKAGNNVVVADSCVGFVSAINTAPTFSDTQGLTFTLLGHNGGQAFFISSSTSPGPESVTLTTPYASGNCNGGTMNVWEVTNLTGVVDQSAYGTQFFGSGTFTVPITTALANDAILVSASGNGTLGVIINPPVVSDGSKGTSSGVFGAYGHLGAATAGTYSASVNSQDGNQATVFMVALATSGSTPPSTPDYRLINSADLPPVLGQSITGSAATSIQSFYRGTAALPSGTPILPGSSNCVITSVASAGALTSSVVSFSAIGNPVAVTGYGVSSTGAVLSVYPYATTGFVNFQTCNSTASSITPGALSVNWSLQ